MSELKKFVKQYGGIDGYCSPTTGIVIEALKKLALAIDKDLNNKSSETTNEQPNHFKIQEIRYLLHCYHTKTTNLSMEEFMYKLGQILG